MGRNILSVVDLGKDAWRRVCGAVASASFLEIAKKSPYRSRGGLHSPYAEGGSYPSEPPVTFSACKAGTLGDPMGGCLSGPK